MKITLGTLRRNSIALGVFLIFYIGYGTFLTLNQEKIVYQPGPQNFDQCSELPDAERISFEGTRMYYKNNGPRIAVLYHGNAGSACGRAFYAELFESKGYSYLLPEYAGYSNDTVAPSHERTKKDVQNVIDFVAFTRAERVVVVGESLGSGVAAYHASLRPPAGLILISSYTTMVDVAQEQYWYYPVSLLMRNEFNSVELLSAYVNPILVIHGAQDDILPMKFGRALFETLKSADKTFLEIPGAGHNTPFDFPETSAAITSFLR